MKVDSFFSGSNMKLSLFIVSVGLILAIWFNSFAAGICLLLAGLVFYFGARQEANCQRTNLEMGLIVASFMVLMLVSGFFFGRMLATII